MTHPQPRLTDDDAEPTKVSLDQDNPIAHIDVQLDPGAEFACCADGLAHRACPGLAAGYYRAWTFEPLASIGQSVQIDPGPGTAPTCRKLNGDRQEMIRLSSLLGSAVLAWRPDRPSSAVVRGLPAVSVTPPRSAWSLRKGT